jgi:hypothetical protein
MYWVLSQSTAKYEDGILVKEEKVLQSITDKLIEILKCYGIEINKGETELTL